VPFSNVAEARMGKSLPSIRRIDRNRTINVTADADFDVADVPAIQRDLTENVLPGLLTDFPLVSASLEGEAREQRESMHSLQIGVALVLGGIYTILAIVFRSYVQPLLVMSAIPFGFVGAIFGHILMGMDLSILSVWGILALSGIVVNDSLVLVDYVNTRRRDGMSLLRAVSRAGAARFRPILLTSLTTFAGLVPLLFEKSRQAQFVIPMAISLAFGILFATFITLILVPSLYLMLEDLKHIWARTWAWLLGRSQPDLPERGSIAMTGEPAAK
jgi:multidrug efflux pump subunit AcrB